MVRILSALISIVVLSACNGASDLDKPAVPLGDFNLYHNIVVAPKVQKLPISREVSEEVLTTAVKDAIAERFDRYDGQQLYHFGVSVEGYVLAQPGIPVVASPKSVLIINLTVWDDAKGKKLNEKPQQITVLESFSTKSVLGSGLTQSKEEQMLGLSRNAAKQIQDFLVKKHSEEGWFLRQETATDSASQDADPAPRAD